NVVLTFSFQTGRSVHPTPICSHSAAPRTSAPGKTDRQCLQVRAWEFDLAQCEHRAHAAKAIEGFATVFS
ncbi:hypothetical protein, partial [Mesorhizobium sp.]|uniref:hypothetical protein n=1 Tax=Mesorhizobium sp. TaxID=1871066 RepID=UPI0026236E4D